MLTDFLPSLKAVFEKTKICLRIVFDPRNSLQHFMSFSRISIQKKHGILGESIAKDFIEKKQKWTIIARNWRCGKYEIDFICRDQSGLIFIEVRARQDHASSSGYYTVNSCKKKTLRKACHLYLEKVIQKPIPFRFDIVEIRLCKNSNSQLNYYRNVPLFDLN